MLRSGNRPGVRGVRHIQNRSSMRASQPRAIETSHKVKSSFLQKQTSRRDMFRGSITLAGNAFLAQLFPATLFRASAAARAKEPSAADQPTKRNKRSNTMSHSLKPRRVVREIRHSICVFLFLLTCGALSAQNPE